MNREKEDKDALFAILTQKAAAFSQTDLVITGIPLKVKKAERKSATLSFPKAAATP